MKSVTLLHGLTGILFVLIFSSWSNKKMITSNDSIRTRVTDTFVYHFGDASLPPPYHRSYTISVTPTKALVTIESYSDVLAKDSVVLTADKYNSFAKSLMALSIRKSKARSSKGCTGGTTKALTLYAGSRKEIKGSLYYCGGQAIGNLSGDVTAAANLFIALIPQLEKKIEATKNN